MKKISDTLGAFLLCAVIGILICFSKEARAGAVNGIGICENIIIPSLLPVLIICNLIINSRCKNAFDILFSGWFEALFNLPRRTACAVVLGLIGGYPAGTLLTHSLFEKGIINGDTARRIMRFNLCGGAAFIITAVGTACYGSIKTGLLLFTSNVISALICALIFRGKSISFESKEIIPCAPNPLSAAAEKTVKALALMSAYIVFFSAVTGIVKLPRFLIPLFEITSGVCTPQRLLPLPYCAFFLSFGGLCVHLQLLGYLKDMGFKYIDFLIGRTMCATLSYAICRIFLMLFPDSVSVYNNISSPVHQFTQGSLSLSAVMIIGCAVAVFDLENRKIKLH